MDLVKWLRDGVSGYQPEVDGCELVAEDGSPSVSLKNLKKLAAHGKIVLGLAYGQGVLVTFTDGTQYLALGFAVGLPDDVYTDRLDGVQEVPHPQVLALAHFLAREVGRLDVPDWVEYLRRFPALPGGRSEVLSIDDAIPGADDSELEFELKIVS